MAKVSRDTIKPNFNTGDRPDQEQFYEVFDSFINFIDDKVEVDQVNKNMAIAGSLTLNTDNQSNNANQIPGTIRWNGTEFEGFDGTTWAPLGGGDSLWEEAIAGDDVYRPDGNIGIGLASTSTLVDKLEVQLGTNVNAKVRLGRAVIGNGPNNTFSDSATFSHTDLRSSNNFAFMQRANGETRINSGPGVGSTTVQKIIFSMAGSEIAAFDNNRLVVGLPALLSPDPSFVLQVFGNAFKTSGGDLWAVTSDERTKEGVKPFEEGLEKLLKLNPVQFTYNGKGGTEKGTAGIGVVAQEIQDSFPYMINRGGSEFLSTNMSALKYVIVNAIKELNEEVNGLKKEISLLKKELNKKKP